MILERTKSWIYKCLTEKNSDSSETNLTEEDIGNFTNEFLLDLRSVFEHFVKAFNELQHTHVTDASYAADLSKDPSLQEIRKKLKGSLLLYDLANKKGFMLFKQGYRLVFSSVNPGQIKIHFFKQKLFGEIETFEKSFINAVTYDTLSINWVHKNHKGFVNLTVLAHYYMRRFLEKL